MGRRARRPQRRADHRPLRSEPVRFARRRAGRRLRAGRFPGAQARALDRPLRAIRPGLGPLSAPRCAARPRRARRRDGRVDRLRTRRTRLRGRTARTFRGRRHSRGAAPARDRRFRRRGDDAGRDRIRLARPQRGQRQLVRGRHGRDRRGVSRDRARRSSDRARGRRRDAALTARLRILRNHPGDVDAQRRTRARQPPLRSRPRWIRDGRRFGRLRARALRRRRRPRRAHLR